MRTLCSNFLCHPEGAQQSRERGRGHQKSGPFSTCTLTSSVHFSSQLLFGTLTHSPMSYAVPPFSLLSHFYFPFWNDWWPWCFAFGQFIELDRPQASFYLTFFFLTRLHFCCLWLCPSTPCLFVQCHLLWNLFPLPLSLLGSNFLFSYLLHLLLNKRKKTAKDDRCLAWWHTVYLSNLCLRSPFPFVWVTWP